MDRFSYYLPKITQAVVVYTEKTLVDKRKESAVKVIQFATGRK